MSSRSFTTTFSVDETAEQAFAAILNVRGWWSGEIRGCAEHLGDEFTYRNEGAHFSRQRTTELVPNTKVVWRVLDACVNFTDNPHEWIGTDITFEVARTGDKTGVCFSHVGLVPDFECFDACSSAWGFYINNSLRSLITTGQGAPNPNADQALRSGRTTK